MFNKIFGGDASTLGESLANQLAKSFPKSLDDQGLPKVSADRLARILEKVYAEAQLARQEQGLGYLRRVRLCHAFQWRLRDMGYSKSFVDLATEGLVVYLSKKTQLAAPELEDAKLKREKRLARERLRRDAASPSEASEAEKTPTHGYTREFPSPRYQDLTEQYRQMHEQGEQFLGLPADQTFPGLSLPPQAVRIKKLVDATKARRILDYGSGKGQQYLTRDIALPGVHGKWPSVKDYWGVEDIHCYDPAYLPFSELPRGAFDGVISTDVLEHCPEEDMPWIVEEIFSYARRFVFANVACYPAKKRLPTGENAHCTIRPKQWWADLIREAAMKHPGVKFEFWVQWKDDDGKYSEDVIRGPS